MTYTTKFEMRQDVWMVRESVFSRIVKCAPCSNTGSVRIGSEDFICPKCNGRAAYAQSAGRQFYVDGQSRIGKITVDDYPDRLRWGGNPDAPNPLVSYMLEATGVGSGQLWEEDWLFATKEEAQHYCDVKNSVLPADEAEMLPSPVDQFGKVL